MMVCVRIILVLFVVLFVSLASPAASRQQPLKSETAINSTTTPVDVDESKIYIVFCIVGECNDFGHGWQTCFCCGNQYRKESCHQTMEECRANCPVCNPNCSPSPPPVQSTMMDGLALAAAKPT
ncbi:unnamed protein product [Urochloa decumbens]|uniref:Embryo surrounding factor 1 brassicaceae domain-containing protein n=1 Tax=Urochloa decumbens TaxID=240449 RepID=A0ABC8YDY6_9POAL